MTHIFTDWVKFTGAGECLSVTTAVSGCWAEVGFAGKEGDSWNVISKYRQALATSKGTAAPRPGRNLGI